MLGPFHSLFLRPLLAPFFVAVTLKTPFATVFRTCPITQGFALSTNRLNFFFFWRGAICAPIQQIKMMAIFSNVISLQKSILHDWWIRHAPHGLTLLSVLPIIGFITVCGLWSKIWHSRARNSLDQWEFDCPEVQRDERGLESTLVKGLAQVIDDDMTFEQK